MMMKVQSYGRMELAQIYFPHILWACRMAEVEGVHG